jgi:amino acid transporter
LIKFHLPGNTPWPASRHGALDAEHKAAKKRDMTSSRQISLGGGVAIAISMVIGSGLFGLPGLAIQTAGPISAVWGWILVIAIMPAMIHIFSYFGRHYPASEGIALYASMGFGSWSRSGILMLTAGSLLAGMPAFFLVGGSYAASLLHLDEATWAAPLAMILAVLTTTANIMGVRQLGLFNSLAVVLILGIIGLVLARAAPEILALLEPAWRAPSGAVTVSSVWLAASIVFWAFQGWENLTFGFGEIRDPARNIPRIFWISFLIVSACYLLFAASVSASFLAGLPVSGLNGLVALLPAGPAGTVALTVMVVILVANANSWVFGASRAFHSAAKGGVLPAFLGRETKRQIPLASLCGALAIYIVVIALIHGLHISPKYAFLATTQGFIILYGGAILAFTRKTRGIKNRLISVVAAIGWIFLMQGFGYLILYSLFWFASGSLVGRKSGTFRNAVPAIEKAES